MILSHTHKFIFFSSSRVGTTSMEEVLRPLQEGAEYDFGSVGAGIVPKHIPPAILRGALSEKVWNDYFKFVFVRNPWDWFISQWFYNSVSASDPRAARLGRVRRRARRALRRAAGRPPRAERPLLVRAHDDTLRIADVDAVFARLKPLKGLPGRDGLYQSNWICDMDGRVIVDYIGRYETLEADFTHIARHLGLDLRLPRLNATAHRDYRAYYSAETRDRVGELWAVDIENLGYSFDGPRPASARSSAGASPGTRSY